MRKKILSILPLYISFLIISCSPNTSENYVSLIGKWLYDSTQGGNEDFQCDIEFFSDGTFIIYPDYLAIVNTFEYTLLESNRICLTSDRFSFVFDYDVDDDKLILYFDDGGYNIYIKESASTSERIVQESISTPISTKTFQITPASQENYFSFDWQIKTGTLKYIGVASDGIIYGVDDELYARISKDGEIIETHEVDLDGCLRYNYTGGSGDIEILQWFYVNQEGVIASFAYQGGPCIIYPDGLIVEKLDTSYTYLPFSDDNLPKMFSEIPDGYRSLQSISSLGSWKLADKLFWLDERRSIFQFYINQDENKGGFIDHNGEFRSFIFEENIDDLYEGRIKFLVTPWDDLYYKYATYDQLGNDTGDVIVRITSDGQREIVPEIPLIFTKGREPSAYLADQKEIFHITGTSIYRYDRNSTLIGEYRLPPEFQEYMNDWQTSVFVGNDHSVYVFDTRENLLLKYSCPAVDLIVTEKPVGEDSENTEEPEDENKEESESATEGYQAGDQMANIKDGAEMVFVPAGEFLMGSEDSDAYIDEDPEHLVYLDAYWIYKYEVSNAQFFEFVVDTGFTTDAQDQGWSYVIENGALDQSSGAYWAAPTGFGSDIVGMENYPVTQISWNDAYAYCEWAGGRLPTEAEWEKAARGESGLKFPWGDSGGTASNANYCDTNCEFEWKDRDSNQDDGYEQTAPVGSYPGGVSPYGALDMAGNVWEWVADWYDETYYNTQTNWNNPTGPESGTARVLRGGSWDVVERSLRASVRSQAYPEVAFTSSGFRCVYLP